MANKHPSGTLRHMTDTAQHRLFTALLNTSKPFQNLMGDIERSHGVIAMFALMGSLDAPEYVAAGGSIFNGYAYQPGVKRYA